MAKTNDLIIQIVQSYIAELENNNIPVLKAFLFGSYIQGNPKEESDIDIAVISEAFTGDRFEDRRKLIPLRRRIDSRIEPMPFRPEDFNAGGNLIDNIKRYGKSIKNRL